MKKTTLALGLGAALAGSAMAQDGAVPKGIPHLDHVFVIMMENHDCKEILSTLEALRSLTSTPIPPISRRTTSPSLIPA
ncbi:MAG TPA: hypothetical protein VIX37_04445 [Candidatus Sulfotelmatobacter sp.]